MASSFTTSHEIDALDVELDRPRARGDCLPPLLELGQAIAPVAPGSIEELGINPDVAADIAMKLAYSVPQFTTKWAAQQLCLPEPIIESIYWQLKQDRFVDVLGEVNLLGNYKYAATDRGRERAERLMKISGYVGPAPVSLEQYSAVLDLQLSRFDEITLEQIEAALQPLVLEPRAAEVTAMAISSGRSLFLFGPPGNGKSTLSRLVHRTMRGTLWLPYAICIDQHIIRLYDPQFHDRSDDAFLPSHRIDARWINVRRPFVCAGGEMTLAEMDLIYSDAHRFYEAPPHMKANGGIFVIDDFGRQQMEPADLLNRWIVPLEQSIDNLTFHNGQKVQVPFRLSLVVATNLKLADVADPAFLRRMGYRLLLDHPDEARWAEIFNRCAEECNLEVPEGMVETLLARYRSESRQIRCSEPGALIERVHDVCRLYRCSFELTEEFVDRAWTGYFGEKDMQ